MAYVMMEAGEQTIVVNQDTGQYFFVVEAVWQNFHKEMLDKGDWVDGNSFVLPAQGETFTDNSSDPSRQLVVGQDIKPNELIAKFVDLERNSGAMIAVRELDAESPRVIDKRRYKKLKLHFDS